MSLSFQPTWGGHDQSKLSTNIYAHLLPLLDTVLGNNASLYKLCDNLLYDDCLSWTAMKTMGVAVCEQNAVWYTKSYLDLFG